MFGAFSIFELLLVIAGGVLLLCLFPFVAGPVFIYFAHKQAARPELVPFTPGQTPLPANVDTYFSQTCWALDAEGFKIVTGMFLPKQIEHIVAGLVLVVNRQECDVAIVVAIHADPPGGMPFTQMHTEFVNRFRDGRLVQTANAQALSSFPPPANSVSSYLPSVQDPRRLYHIHKALVKQHASSEKVLRLDEDFGGDAIRYAQFSLIEELNNACRVGFMRLDLAAGVYRPTIKGACLMTWQEIFPLKNVRLVRRRRRERRLLEELAYQVPELAGIGK
ncbi:MAG TPA: hypothetical protein VFV87_19700 [Pirellulaceae bacterium]|nr:hypothetical protein [Pirellulaceae bacterium]